MEVAGLSLRDIDIALSIIVALCSGVFGVLIWYDRRGRSYVDGHIGQVIDGQTRTHARLDKLEERVGLIEDDMARADRRLTGIEGRLESLFTKDQGADLRERMGRIEGTIERLVGSVDTLYRAAHELSRRP